MGRTRCPPNEVGNHKPDEADHSDRSHCGACDHPDPYEQDGRGEVDVDAQMPRFTLTERHQVEDPRTCPQPSRSDGDDAESSAERSPRGPGQRPE